MSEFMDRMKKAAQADLKRVVLAEGEDQRVVEAARIVAAEKLADVIVLGDPATIDAPGATIIDPRTSDKLDAYCEKLAELRAKKGMTVEKAREVLTTDYASFGTMMVKMGDADGLVSGACHSTANTIRPALQILKTAPDAKIASAFEMICVPNCEFGENGTLMFADSGLNEYPDAEKLSEIAIQSAKSWKELMGTEPVVAMLSYSTKGSASSEWVDKVRTATELVNQKAPELACDGEMQLDAALVESVGASKAPGSKVAGHANVLIFPNLDAGNTGYKLAQRLAKAEAYGPLTQGLAKPVNDLSRGCFTEDIVGAVAVTAVQAQMAAK